MPMVGMSTKPGAARELAAQKVGPARHRPRDQIGTHAQRVGVEHVRHHGDQVARPVGEAGAVVRVQILDGIRVGADPRCRCAIGQRPLREDRQSPVPPQIAVQRNSLQHAVGQHQTVRPVIEVEDIHGFRTVDRPVDQGVLVLHMHLDAKAQILFRLKRDLANGRIARPVMAKGDVPEFLVPEDGTGMCVLVHWRRPLARWNAGPWRHPATPFLKRLQSRGGDQQLCAPISGRVLSLDEGQPVGVEAVLVSDDADQSARRFSASAENPGLRRGRSSRDCRRITGESSCAGTMAGMCSRRRSSSRR